MKAGAFGRTRERRQVQPGGRVLPGTFSAPAETPSASNRASTSRAASKGSDAGPPPRTGRAEPSPAFRGSGTVSTTGRSPPISRFDKALIGAVETPAAFAAAATPKDSISRARRLGLNRAARTPSPEPEEASSSPEPSDNGIRSGVPPVDASADRRRRARSEAKQPASPPRAREPPASPPAPAAQSDQPVPRPLPGLLSSLWNRASQLVGAEPAGSTATGEDEGKGAADNSEVSAADEAPSRDSADNSGGSPTEAGRNGRSSRPLIVPALVAPALGGAAASQPRRAVSGPAISTPPPPEPITYHRPPLPHPSSSAASQTPRFRSQPSPFDWLDPRDESRLAPFVFLPTAEQAAAFEARLRAKAASAHTMRPHSDPGWQIYPHTAPPPSDPLVQ